MKAHTMILTAALALLGLAACGSSNNSGNDSADNAPPPVSHTVFAPYIKDLNKAKNVQNTLQAEKQKTDQALQQAESGTSTAPAAASQPPQ